MRDNTRQTSLRLPVDLDDWVDAYARDSYTSKSTVIRQALSLLRERIEQGRAVATREGYPTPPTKWGEL